MNNEFSPVFRFVICSDSHIEGVGTPGYLRLKKTIDYSLDFASKAANYNKIDAFFISAGQLLQRFDSTKAQKKSLTHSWSFMITAQKKVSIFYAP